MIAEAVDTAFTLGKALAVWVLLLAAAATLALGVAVASPCHAAADAVTAALAASRAVHALHGRPDRYTPRQRPLWAAA